MFFGVIIWLSHFLFIFLKKNNTMDMILDGWCDRQISTPRRHIKQEKGKYTMMRHVTGSELMMRLNHVLMKAKTIIRNEDVLMFFVHSPEKPPVFSFIPKRSNVLLYQPNNIDVTPEFFKDANPNHIYQCFGVFVEEEKTLGYRIYEVNKIYDLIKKSPEDIVLFGTLFNHPDNNAFVKAMPMFGDYCSDEYRKHLMVYMCVLGLGKYWLDVNHTRYKYHNDFSVVDFLRCCIDVHILDVIDDSEFDAYLDEVINEWSVDTRGYNLNIPKDILVRYINRHLTNTFMLDRLFLGIGAIKNVLNYLPESVIITLGEGHSHYREVVRETNPKLFKKNIVKNILEWFTHIFKSKEK